MNNDRRDYRLERRIIKGAIIFVIVATILSMMTAPLILAITVTVIHPPFQPQIGTEPESQSQIKPSPKATQDIPGLYLQLYQQAGERFHVPWPILAGIGRVECNHGRLTAIPGCQPGQANAFGAAGPMQFLKDSTWKAYALPGMNDIYNPMDAIMAAGNKLASDGAKDPAGIRQAIFAYNHDSDYVNSVLDFAQQYTQGDLWSVIGQWQQGLQSASTNARSATNTGINAGQSVAGAIGGSVGTSQITPVQAPAIPGVPARGFSTGTFPFGQCTWWAAFNHNGVTWNGNATDWWANSPANLHMSQPAVGSIAVWKAGTAYGMYGHVAIVTAVQQNSFTVSEMNYRGWGVVDQRVTSFPDPSLWGFIK